MAAPTTLPDPRAATASPRSTSWQLGDSLGASGAAFMIGVRAVLTLIIFLAPWALVGLLVWLVVRRRLRTRAATPGTSG